MRQVKVYNSEDELLSPKRSARSRLPMSRLTERLMMIRMMAPPCSDLSVFHVASTLQAMASNLLVMALNSNLPAMTYKQLSGVENPPELLLRLLQPFANPF